MPSAGQVEQHNRFNALGPSPWKDLLQMSPHEECLRKLKLGHRRLRKCSKKTETRTDEAAHRSIAAAKVGILGPTLFRPFCPQQQRRTRHAAQGKTILVESSDFHAPLHACKHLGFFGVLENRYQIHNMLTWLPSSFCLQFDPNEVSCGVWRRSLSNFLQSKCLWNPLPLLGHRGVRPSDGRYVYWFCVEVL
jgi:hypothetical protein